MRPRPAAVLQAKDIKLRLAFDSKARQILRESLIWTLFLITVAIVCRGHTTVEDTFSANTAIRLMLEKGVYADMGLADVSLCVTDTVTAERGLRRHIFCRDISMLVATTLLSSSTKLCLSRQKGYLWQLPPVIIYSPLSRRH